MPRFGGSRRRVGIFYPPDLDMSCADRDKIVVHPGYFINVTRTFIAGMERCSSSPGVDAPDV